MVINHYGAGMVKAQLGDRIIVFNPIGPTSPRLRGASEAKPAKFGADLALVSLNDPDYNGTEEVSRGERVPFVIDGPGEYEVEGNFVQGIGTAGPSGKLNTAYLLVFDGMRLVHLGALAKAELDEKTIEKLGAIDILFVPVGNGMDPKAASKLATALSPRAVVPVCWESASLAAFLKEMGEESAKPVDGWTVKKKDLTDKESDVIVVKSF